MGTAPKTRPTDESVDAFLAAVETPRRRRDAQRVCAMMAEASGEPPVMWGAAIVGFGSAPTATGDWPRIAFSPRKADLVLYGLRGAATDEVLARLGPVRAGAGCLYVKDLDALDAGALRELFAAAWAPAPAS